MFISRFQSLEPLHIVSQADGLNWLAAAHARESGDISADQFHKLLRRFGCGPDRIAQRGTFLRDFTHQNWGEMQIFGARRRIEDRQAFFREVLLEPVNRLYSEAQPDFTEWIHVTCTGYLSPSLVQTLVSTRGWGGLVQVTHAYHMGCYAALPALRMARGARDAEILHTELCTLHLDPSNHEPEQLVIQSLFADGVIRYRASERAPGLGFKIEDMREVIVPGTLPHMSWDLSGEGFRMSLAREVPKLVQQAVASVIDGWREPGVVYAIHPGGPRIIDGVKEGLALSEEQVVFSREVLRRHGNMSSATLPHVWQLMLGNLPAGTPVISLAFGPGLTIASSKMRKVG